MRFTDDFISPLGTMNLYVTFKDKSCFKIILTKFVVVDIPPTYNAIIGKEIDGGSVYLPHDKIFDERDTLKGVRMFDIQRLPHKA